MTHHSNQNVSIVAAEEPTNDKNDVASRSSNNNRRVPNTAAAQQVAPSRTVVEIRHRGKISSILSMLSCCRKASITDSVHFHANQVEDSVHVMIKHDKEACKRRGQPESHYEPRAPLAERLVAARKMEAARLQQQGSSHATISAREDESETDRDILAAVTKADCCDSAAVAASAVSVTTGSANR